MSSVPAWLWLTAGWCAVVLGAWLLVTGRRKWRRKTGRCCRRCGYDMSGVPGMTCSECGLTAGNEREMRRLPARKRWRLAGAALLCVGWLVWQAPAVIAHGWAGGVPGWVLVRWAPIKTDAADATTVRDLLNPMMNPLISTAMGSPLPRGRRPGDNGAHQTPAAADGPGTPAQRPLPRNLAPHPQGRGERRRGRPLPAAAL